MFSADAHFGAAALVRHSEAELEALLDEIYGTNPDDWRHFETDSRDRSVEVFGVLPSPASAAALLNAGFSVVTQHEHDYGDFRSCACNAYWYESQSALHSGRRHLGALR